MNTKILAELEFDSILNESMAQTQTGNELLNKYKSYLMANESTFGLVNNFVREAQNYRYDNGVNHVLEMVADYINCNKTVWALATACESINANSSSYNYLNRNASKQVEKLLEMNEDDVIKYIKAGALKNVMFCESFRNIAKQVFKNQPIIESSADYTLAHPISLIENVGDGVCFAVAGRIYKIDDSKHIQEAMANEVSNTFRTIMGLLESNLTTVDSDTITISVNNTNYLISECGKCIKESKGKSQELTVEQLRENNNLVLMATNPRHKVQLAGVLEAIALTCENYDKIANMDNVAIVETKNDKFLVIESGNNLYSTLLMSNRNPKWTINENAIETLTFIKKKTNVSLSEHYNELVSNTLEQVTEEEKAKVENELHEQKINSYKERIEILTEKFKNDPVKLAILSKLAKDISKA